MNDREGMQFIIKGPIFFQYLTPTFFVFVKMFLLGKKISSFLNGEVFVTEEAFSV